MYRWGLLAGVVISSLAGCTVLSGASDLESGSFDSRVPRPDAASSNDGGAPGTSDAALGTSDAAASQDGSLGGDATTSCDEPGLFALWRFDEGSGPTAHDCTSHAYDGTIAGATWTQGIHGGALSFDGGWVDFGAKPDFEITGPQTMAAWIKITSSFFATRYVVGKGSDNSGYRLATEMPSISLAFNHPGGTESIGGDVPTNTWVHIASVFRPGSAMELYVGGIKVDELTFGVPSGSVASTSPLRIGASSTGDYPFRGAIDEVRIYTRALSAAEIAALATQ